MQEITGLDVIVARAGKLNLSLHTLCVRAGSDYSLWNKWRRGKMSPTMRVLARELEKLESCLSELEDDMFAYLSAIRAARTAGNGAQIELGEALAAEASA